MAEHLLFPSLRVRLCNGRDSENAFTTISVGDQCSVTSNIRYGAATDDRKECDRAEGTVIFIQYGC